MAGHSYSYRLASSSVNSTEGEADKLNIKESEE